MHTRQTYCTEYTFATSHLSQTFGDPSGASDHTIVDSSNMLSTVWTAKLICPHKSLLYHILVVVHFACMGLWVADLALPDPMLTDLPSLLGRLSPVSLQICEV